MRHITARLAPAEGHQATVEASRRPAARRVLPIALALWAFGYASYRAYYAAGGTFGMIGQPVSVTQFRTINAVGAVVILLAAILPLVAVRSFPRAVPALGWIGAVGCCMHALVDGVLRVFSMTGVHPTQLPADVWQSFDRHTADLQDLLLNEPWFLIEGLLWAALGLAYLGASRRRGWLASVVVGCLLLATVGVLSGLDIVGSFRFS
jgi:hypothetical protein